MKSLRAILLLTVLSTLLTPVFPVGPVSAGYSIPDYPVMMRINVASNGSFALIAVTLSAYGNPPNHMCPIDSPDTYIGCRELSFRDYLLFEVGDGLRYVNVTPALSPFNFTIFSPASLNDKWFLTGKRSHHFPCSFGACVDSNYTVVEYWSEGKTVRQPANVSTLTAKVLLDFPKIISSKGVVSGESLLFSFPYINETYAVPLDAFGEYLKLLDFSDSSGLDAERFLGFFQAVPFRDGLILYLPSYGLESYTSAPYMSREYILVENESNPYIPYAWVAHSGLVCFPGNSSGISLTREIFPPVFYYRNGKLRPLLNFSLEALNWTLEGSGEGFTCTRPILETPNETRAKVGGESFVPDLGLPSEKNRIYLSVIRPFPHYSPGNTTIIDFCVNLGNCTHAEFDGRSLTYLKIPFPGLFVYSRDSWLYRSMTHEECRDFCAYWRAPHYNGTFRYDPVKRTLSLLSQENFSGSWGEPGWYRVYKANETSLRLLDSDYNLHDIPLKNLLECAQTPEAAKMLRGIDFGDGILFYYPMYAAEVSLKEKETAVLWGSYDSSTEAPLNKTCILFYYSNGSIKFALRPETAPVDVSVGDWKIEMSIPYLDLKNSTDVSVGTNHESPPTSTSGGSGGICGPAVMVGLSPLPLFLRRKRQG
ncbi:CGP-CTERM sorting domain-containing protein [Thermococcus thermotolerans]|uniref:CGP-CTERM sorting domain-containing protein n=1 Tax=Thermococcus thermotolerans TaxID=2969672 RepID=UPI002157D7D7|nr:CGP-CTERM sorting domain-containing protein [Thermococcus thermotolerans]